MSHFFSCFAMYSMILLASAVKTLFAISLEVTLIVMLHLLYSSLTQTDQSFIDPQESTMNDR
jgi:hypothetical protein